MLANFSSLASKVLHVLVYALPRALLVHLFGRELGVGACA